MVVRPARVKSQMHLAILRRSIVAAQFHGRSSSSLWMTRSLMRASTSQVRSYRRPGRSFKIAYFLRSAADAEALFRSLQAKFPNQLGGREPIVRRTDLGPEGIYSRASIGPFASMKAAAKVCSGNADRDLSRQRSRSDHDHGGAADRAGRLKTSRFHVQRSRAGAEGRPTR